MFNEETKIKIKGIHDAIIERIETKHIGCFSDRDKPLFLISETYPGVWMEHIYDAVIYARLDPTKKELAKITLLSFPVVWKRCVFTG